MKNVFYSSKKFLNLDGFESDASIFTRIEFYNETSTGATCDLKIRDCFNKVDLIIDIGEDLGNSIFKLDTIIGELNNLKSALLQAEIERLKREQTEKDEEDKANSGGRALPQGTELRTSL